MLRRWGPAVAPAPPGAALTGSARRNAFGNSLADSVSFRFLGNLSDLDRSTAANDLQSSASFSAR
jgi:hypothetical protein